MRKKIGKWVLIVLSLPLMVGWIFPLLACLCFAAKWSQLRIEEGLVLSTVWRPWAAARWDYSTTLFRGIVYWPGDVGGKWAHAHEHVHVRQFEDATIQGLVLAFLVTLLPPAYSVWVGWAVAPALLGMQWLTSWLRGQEAYYDSEMERSAYAQTDLDGQLLESSWLSRRETTLRRQ